MGINYGMDARDEDPSAESKSFIIFPKYIRKSVHALDLWLSQVSILLLFVVCQLKPCFDAARRDSSMGRPSTWL